MSSATATGIADRVTELVRGLRRAGVAVAVSDGLDAQRAVAAIDLLDREQLRAALAATTLKTARQRSAFDLLFDAYFPPRPDIAAGEDDPDRDVRQFLAELVDAILDGDEAAVESLARAAVGSFGTVTGQDGSAGWFAYRMFSQISPDGLLRRLLTAAAVDQDSLAGRLVRDELQDWVRRFKTGVEAEVRRRQAARRGPDHVARTLVRTLPEDTDFFRISAAEEAEMRRAVRPLARRLAARLALRRRHAREGRLDARRTLRSAVSTGGVPLDPAFRSRRPHRAEIVLLCDVSGSVSAFARFSLLFTHALQGQLSRVRSFAFVDVVDEVTSLFEEADASEAFRRMATEARVTRFDGHSDYGSAFAAMLDQHGDAIGPRTTLMILGDARNNYRATRADALAELRSRARRVYWLNPEPSSSWDTGDSVMRVYAPCTDATLECRNLRQLAEIIERLS